MDDVIINAPQFADIGTTQMPHGFVVHTTYGFANTQRDQVDIHFESMSNESDVLTVSPLAVSLRDLRTVLGGLLSRIHQYCVVQQSASLSGWWAGALGAADTVYSFDTVYFAISGTLRSIRECARMEAFIDTSASRRFITSCRVLAYNASLHSPRMLCWFSIPQNIGCGLN